jgi:sulfite reductase alpha subunit-like flavoprotein
MAKGIVVYHSRSGNTKEMAEIIAEAMNEAGVSTECKPVDKVHADDIPAYNAVVIGSPCYYGQMAAPVKELRDFQRVVLGNPRRNHALDAGDCPAVRFRDLQLLFQQAARVFRRWFQRFSRRQVRTLGHNRLLLRLHRRFCGRFARFARCTGCGGHYSTPITCANACS